MVIPEQKKKKKKKNQIRVELWYNVMKGTEYFVS